MPMQVRIQDNRVSLMESLNELFYGDNFRKELWARFLPHSVQVDSTEGAAIVTIDDTVYIDHGYYLEHKMLPKCESFYILLIGQEVYYSLHDVRAVRLARVDPCCDDHAFPLSHFRCSARLCNSECLDPVPRQSLAYSLSLDILRFGLHK